MASVAGRSRAAGWPVAAGVLAGAVADALLGDPRRGHPVALFGRAARAVVESVAENTSDAVVAPLVWGVLGGLPGLVGYRAVNTLDAMVGYRSPPYARFGWASARLDDVANWAPARLTGVLAAACSLAVGGRPSATWRAMRRYGGRHPSPNAGRCEAAFAGALGVRLGGTNVYAGTTEQRPGLGQGRVPEPGDIRRAVRLCRTIRIAATAAAAVSAVTIAAIGEEGAR